MAGVQLIVGLANPGSRYAGTRHNVGGAWLESVARAYHAELRSDRRFKGALARVSISVPTGEGKQAADVRLLLPDTYMNLSGDSLGAVARFYQIPAEAILVAYDEVAFAPGVIKLKTGGGHNGQNGIKSVIAALGSRDFQRLRIGVGHPGNSDDMVAYLTSRRPPATEREHIAAALERVSAEVLGLLAAGQIQQAINLLHAPA